MKIYLPLPSDVVDVVVAAEAGRHVPRVVGRAKDGSTLFDLAVHQVAVPWVTAGRVNGLIVDVVEHYSPPFDVLVEIARDAVARLVVADVFVGVLSTDVVAFADLVAP